MSTGTLACQLAASAPLSGYAGRIAGIVDVVFIALLTYGVLVWLKRTRRANNVLLGLLIVVGVYVGARAFDLTMTKTVLEGFFAIFLIALIIIFQEELRQLLEQVARWTLRRRFRTLDEGRVRSDVETLAATSFDLAAEQQGALMVLPGRDPIARHIDGGEELGGALSEAILRSIFDHHSIGHDGAVVVRGNRIVRFGSHLPLSKTRLERGGTRHAAALGLAEISDALCIVVSEERGTVSVARGGELEVVPDRATLMRTLEAFYDEKEPPKKTGVLRELVASNTREKIITVLVSAALYVVLIHANEEVQRELPLSVHWQVGENLERVSQDPETLRVRLAGPRKSFYFLEEDEVRVVLPAGPRPESWNVTVTKDHVVNEAEGIRVVAVPEVNAVIKLKKTDGPGGNAVPDGN